MPYLDESSWSSDDETPGQVAVLVESEALVVGLWRTGGSPQGPFEVQLQHDETIYVLSGTGELEVDGQPPVHLGAGLALTIPRGSLTPWTVDAAFTELWIYH